MTICCLFPLPDKEGAIIWPEAEPVLALGLTVFVPPVVSGECRISPLATCRTPASTNRLFFGFG